jgi:dTDP-4-dehydrorhamnose reductase
VLEPPIEDIRSIEAVATTDLPPRVKRPLHSVLDASESWRISRCAATHWRDALDATISELDRRQPATPSRRA